MSASVKASADWGAGGDIVSDKTDAALVEFMKELRGIQGGRPITDEEMQMAKDTLIQRLPAQFSSVSAIGSTITSLYLQDLPPDFQWLGAAPEHLKLPHFLRPSCDPAPLAGGA